MHSVQPEHGHRTGIESTTEISILNSSIVIETKFEVEFSSTDLNMDLLL